MYISGNDLFLFFLYFSPLIFDMCNFRAAPFPSSVLSFTFNTTFIFSFVAYRCSVLLVRSADNSHNIDGHDEDLSIGFFRVSSTGGEL